jgi:peptidoglycan/LPS O-acetylase OafA/YrhL
MSNSVTPISRTNAIAAAMALEGGTLAVMSLLHLSGTLSRGSQPYDPSGAGVAEGVICIALLAGSVALYRHGARARPSALAAVAFAVAGFIIGLTFTASGGTAVDLGYHAIMLPAVAATLVALFRVDPESGTVPGRHGPAGHPAPR